MPHTPSNEEMNAARLLFNSFSTTYMPFVKGDIIVNGSSKRKILEVLGSIVFTSITTDFSKCDGGYAYTHQELISAGWQVEVKDWEPDWQKEYWCVDGKGMVVQVTWLGDDFDSFRLATNNCFRTKEEAERHRENMLKK